MQHQDIDTEAINVCMFGVHVCHSFGSTVRQSWVILTPMDFVPMLVNPILMLEGFSMTAVLMLGVLG